MDEEHIEVLSQHPVGAHVQQALERLIEQDLYLFRVDANERSLTHKSACYLQNHMSDWEVDCEYNRDGHDLKELHLPRYRPDDEDSNASTVYPDVIVHKRDTDQNILVIEFKKTSNPRGRNNDYIKLREFKVQLGYQNALFIELSVRPNPSGVNYVEWV